MSPAGFSTLNDNVSRHVPVAKALCSVDHVTAIDAAGTVYRHYRQQTIFNVDICIN